MLQSRTGRYRFLPRACGALLTAVTALLAHAPPVSSQAAPPAEEPDSVIEWNFQPVAAPREAASLEERWAAPFAVESRGRPVARTPRPVVVLRDSAAARRVAAAQVREGESTAEVRVQPGAGAGAAGRTAAAPAPAAGAAADDDDSPEPEEAEPERAVATPAPARASPTPAGAGGNAAAAAGARTHRVAYGETWYGIARQYRVSSARLAAANPDVDPERLRSGTVLRIPAAGTTPAAAAPAATRIHTVTRG
ncbi:MAG TPA: LysM domain-containing protein, partial [Longimicrobiaceae bacterium]